MKNVVLLIILAVFLTSCKASENSLPSVFTPVTTSITTESTAVSFSPTLIPMATLPKEDFAFPTAFFPFYDQFPLSLIPQSKGYSLHCVFDAEQIQYKAIRISNVEIRKWVKCYFFTSNHEVDYVTIPLHMINWDNLTWFSTFVAENPDAPRENPNPCVSSNECGYTEIIPEDKPIALRFEWTNLPHKYILGLGFGTELTDEDLSQSFFKPLTEEKFQRYFDEFAATGMADRLPQFGHVENFLLAYEYFPYVSK